MPDVSLIIVVVLILGVIFVNGWTDAPNAIATVVSTRVMSPKFAVRMAVVFNFLGALVMTIISPKVAETLSDMVDFTQVGSTSKSDVNMPLVVLAAAMFSIVIWAVAAWYFGIPTSESHALIAGLTGGAFALGGLDAIIMSAWFKVVIGLGISSVLGFIMGFIFTKFIEFSFKNMRRSSSSKLFSAGQAGGAAAMAFMHGAQDGQKFMGVFLIAMSLHNGQPIASGAEFQVDFWLIAVCSITMGIGTSIGGYRIIKAVGMDMVKLEKYQGFSADLSASACLLLSTLTGIPVSTTHTKTASIMGVGASRRLSAVNWGVVREMVLAWILTFPGCGLIAYLMAKLFMLIF